MTKTLMYDDSPHHPRPTLLHNPTLASLPTLRGESSESETGDSLVDEHRPGC